MNIVPESRFTDPRPDCQHPEWWHATDEQSTEVEISELLAGFVRALQPEYVLETGACFGQTSNAIGYSLALNGHGKLDSLEPDDDRADRAESLCSGLPVEIHRVKSLDFVPRGHIDFMFLDSLIELRVPEFNYFSAWLSDGAVVAFHDTGPHKAEGKYGEEVRLIPNLRYLQLNTPRGLTLGQYDWR